MTIRRAVLVLIVLLTGLGLGSLLLAMLAPGGWTAAKLIMLAAFLGTAPWTGLCLANGLIGFVRLPPRVGPGDHLGPGFRGDGGGFVSATDATDGRPRADQSASSTPRPGVPLACRVAIAVTVRSEDMRLVLPPLRRLLDELDQAGVGEHFALCVLSDTQDPVAAMAEEAAVAAFRADDGDPGRVRYRRRPHNTGFKAGNVMDFLDHHAAGFDLMLTLDADSRMSAQAVLRLVRAIEADPSLGIVQHLTVGLPAAAAFPRLFQFGMRAGMRIWASGQDWWQGDEGPYWGHNAVVRIMPFRAHCRLPLLPNGQPILSHDQVEAAMLRAAGWGVRVLAVEDGSAEANPPALPEFLRRELRWLAGNLQYWHLLGMPGLRPLGRWQLVQAILLFAGTPLYLLFLVAASWAAATDHTSPFPVAPALGLSLAWACTLYAPKLLGYVRVMLSPAERRRHGGTSRFVAGAVAEAAFSLMLDAIAAVAKTGAMLRLARGMPAAWLPQNRTERGVSWSEAARLCWPQTMLGLLVFAGFAGAGPRAVLWAAPFAGGLLAAIPFCKLTADARFGRWLRHRLLAAIPEEIPPPHTTAPHWPALAQPSPLLRDVSGG